MALRQRAKVHSRLIFIPETSFGADPGGASGYVLNLASESGFQVGQARVEVPTWKGNLYPHKSLLGRVLAQGKTALQLEFLTSGRLWKTLVGANGYNRPGGGTTTLHDFYIPTAAGAIGGSCQLQADSLEATAIYERARAVMLGGIGMNYGTEGGAGFDADFIGTGDVLQTALVTGGSVVDEGFTPVSYFNGQILLNSVALEGMTSFAFNIATGLTRTEVGFNNGKAGSLVGGKMLPTLNLGLLMATTGASPEADMAYYNYAVNNSTIPADVVWADAPLATADKWCRVRMPGLKFERASWKPGGEGGLMIQQPARAEESGNLAAEHFGTVRAATFNVDATNNKFAVKLDGGGTITVTLTIGAARTPTQIAADLNADGTFAAAATADVYMGRVRVTSDQVGGTGTASSVQFDTTVANHSGTLLGFDNVARAGYNLPFLLQIYNTKTTDY